MRDDEVGDERRERGQTPSSPGRARGSTPPLLAAILADFGDRVLPMDAAVALRLAQLAEAARPQVVGLADLIIAATASVHGLTVLTRNIRHFTPTGVDARDPLATLPDDVGP
ncbi:PIN domain-containing protein [Ancylobacter moscoviensis]